MQPKAAAEPGSDKSPLSAQTQTKLPVLEECDIGLWLLKEYHR